jgi:hypothetical protein
VIARRVLGLAPLLLVASPASAKSSSELGWPIDQVFSTALRFVRVDRNCKVVDRDEPAGYLVFECPVDEKDKPGVTRRGALELVRVEDRGRPVVRAQVTLTDEPRWVELRFLELLERKLRDEHGTPPPPRPAPALHPDAGS